MELLRLPHLQLSMLPLPSADGTMALKRFKLIIGLQVILAPT